MPTEEGVACADKGLEDNGPGQQQGTTIPNDQSARGWVKYRVEWRHRATYELLYQKNVEDLVTDNQGHDQNRHHGPAFEAVTTFVARRVDAKNSNDSELSEPPPVSHIAPSYHLNIHSRSIINALQSVVQYYPEHDLTGDVITVKWPYPILVHHYDELSKFREDCARQEPSKLCARQIDAYDHLGLLLQFLDKHVMADVNAEKERNKKGFETFEWLWVRRKPGTTVLMRHRESKNWAVSVLHSISGGTFNYPPTEWSLKRWRMRHDGKYLGRQVQRTQWEKYDGEFDISDYFRIIDPDADIIDEEVAKHIKYGESYWDLLRKQCKHYEGETLKFPHNKVSLFPIDRRL